MTTPHDLAGRQLGDYTLTRKLTTGGMAHIYLGEDRKLGRRAAIKILTPDIIGYDDSLRERFEREARAIGQLEHDSIVPIYQFGQEESLYFLAMRYIEGNDLADEVKKYRTKGELMPIARALFILRQVASALDYAHQHNIIHRDVKPSNILLGKDDKAVLTDFGLVLWRSVDQTMGTAFGTPRYISPEQATDSMSVVPQSDIYSLAVVIYELITGQVMFSGATPMEVALSHITEAPTPPRDLNPNIPPEAERELLKALQKDAHKRHDNALELIEKLEKAYGVDVPPSTAPQRPPSEKVKEHGTLPIPPQEMNAQLAKSAARRSDIKDDAWTVADNPSFKEKPARKFPMPVIGAGVIVALIIAVLAAMNVFNNPNPSPSATSTEALLVVVASATEAGTNGGTASPDFEASTTVIALSARQTVEGENTATQSALLNEHATGTQIALDLRETISAEGTGTSIALTDSVTASPTRTPQMSATPSPTSTPTFTPSPIPMPSTVDLQVLYNASFLAIQNPHPFAAANLANLRLVGAEGEAIGADFGERLAPNSCIFVKLNNASDNDIPANWNCRGQARTTLSNNSQVYWIADSATDTIFTLFAGETVLGTCETVGRAVQRFDGACSLTWDRLTDTR